MEFTLRPWTMDDVPALAAYANNPKIARYMTDGFPNPYGEADAKRFIANAMKPENHFFCIAINGKGSGGIGLHPQNDISRKNAELGYWLAEPFWGNGIISKAIPQVVKYGFENLDIERIFARPFGTNVASQRVLEKLNFTFEGRFERTVFKNGEFEDELFYAVRRS